MGCCDCAAVAFAVTDGADGTTSAAAAVAWAVCGDGGVTAGGGGTNAGGPEVPLMGAAGAGIEADEVGEVS